MNKVGFIGYGSMGSMLIEGFLASGVLSPSLVIVATRSPAKIEPLGQRWPGIKLAQDNSCVAHEAGILFLCVKPLDVLPVLAEIKAALQPGIHLVSIAAGVTLADIQALVPGMVSRVFPSVTSEVRQGISLICHNEHVRPEDSRKVEALLQGISRVIQIDEQDFEAAADLTSCAPGIIAAMFKHYVEAGLRNSRLDEATVHEMVLATLRGTVSLLQDKQLGFAELITRVATKGGVTEEAIHVLNRHLPSMFDEVFESTLDKHNKLKTLVRTQAVEIKPN